jgi:hypothetical protein
LLYVLVKTPWRTLISKSAPIGGIGLWPAISRDEECTVQGIPIYHPPTHPPPGHPTGGIGLWLAVSLAGLSGPLIQPWWSLPLLSLDEWAKNNRMGIVYGAICTNESMSELSHDSAWEG